MSYAEIYVIDRTGQVATFDKVHNPHGWMPRVWDGLAVRFGIVKERFSLHRQEDYAKVWKLFDDPRLSPVERLMLGATFDRVWLRHDRCGELADALDVFNDQVLSELPDCTPTARSVAVIVRRALAEMPDLMGLCFRGTSVSESMWYEPPPPGEEDHGPLINILKQPLCRDGNQHWELSAYLQG